TGTSVGPGQFLPRIGVAYRLNDKTVVRAGYGLSADPKPYIDFRNAFPINFAWQMPAAQFNGTDNSFIPVTTLRTGLLRAVAGTPPDLTKGVIKLPPNVGTTTFPKDSMRKYIHSWNLTVQRELSSKFNAQIAYVGTRAIGQEGFVNINTSAPGTGTTGRALFPLGVTAYINDIAPVGTASYDGLQTQLTGRVGGSIFGAVYTFSKAINFQDNDANPRIPFPADIGLNKGRASYDRTHNFQAYWTADLPFGAGHRWASNGLIGRLAGGWQVNGILSAESGNPFAIIQNNGGNLNAAGSSQVPDQINPVVNILGGVGPGHPYFDTTAFAAVNIPAGQPQRFGTVGRNTLVGPGYFDIDMGLFRSFTITERIRLQFRAESFDILN
ncbi:MAG: TonB-dependent receptor, partial [Blastocatellia bacterium]